MSLGFSVSQAINDAVNAAVEAVTTILPAIPCFNLALSLLISQSTYTQALLTFTSSHFFLSHCDPCNSCMQGVSFSVSAGNDAGDACKKSPASATDWYVHLDSFACIFSIIIVLVCAYKHAKLCTHAQCHSGGH